jgi:hypothetical protein
MYVVSRSSYQISPVVKFQKIFQNPKYIKPKKNSQKVKLWLTYCTYFLLFKFMHFFKVCPFVLLCPYTLLCDKKQRTSLRYALVCFFLVCPYSLIHGMLPHSSLRYSLTPITVISRRYECAMYPTAPTLQTWVRILPGV